MVDRELGCASAAKVTMWWSSSAPAFYVPSPGRGTCWRAVDQNGVTPDILIQSRRDAPAAKRLLRNLLKKQTRPPQATGIRSTATVQAGGAPRTPPKLGMMGPPPWDNCTPARQNAPELDGLGPSRRDARQFAHRRAQSQAQCPIPAPRLGWSASLFQHASVVEAHSPSPDKI